MGWILNILALILFTIIAIVDVFIKLFTKRSENTAYSTGYKLNVFANEAFGDSLNHMMLKKRMVQFGIFGEPLSSAFGKAREKHKLNDFGHFWRWVIDTVDVPMWIKGKSHCREWIRTIDEIKKYRSTLK